MGLGKGLGNRESKTGNHRVARFVLSPNGAIQPGECCIIIESQVQDASGGEEPVCKEKTMNLVIDPNLAYVLLVSGFVLAVLALFSPGTGVVEVGALFALMVAGYGVATLPTIGGHW